MCRTFILKKLFRLTRNIPLKKYVNLLKVSKYHKTIILPKYTVKVRFRWMIMCSSQVEECFCHRYINLLGFFSELVRKRGKVNWDVLFLALHWPLRLKNGVHWTLTTWPLLLSDSIIQPQTLLNKLWSTQVKILLLWTFTLPFHSQCCQGCI